MATTAPKPGTLISHRHTGSALTRVSSDDADRSRQCMRFQRLLRVPKISGGLELSRGQII
jgi:hypothetical protein